MSKIVFKVGEKEFSKSSGISFSNLNKDQITMKLLAELLRHVSTFTETDFVSDVHLYDEENKKHAYLSNPSDYMNLKIENIDNQ